MNAFPSSIPLELPQSIARSLRVYQQQHALSSPEAAILQILEQFLPSGGDESRYATQAQFQALEARVARLQASLTPLLAVAPQPAAPRERLPVAPSSGSATFTFLSQQEDIDDEPDEILYDFIE